MHEIGFIAIRKYRGKYLVRTHLNRDEARPIIKFLYRELVEYLKVKLVKAFGPDDRQSIEQSDSTITPDVRQGDFELPKPGSKITQVLAIMEPGTIVTHVMGLVEYEPNETRLSLVRELNEILKNPIPEELTNNPDTWGKFGEMTYGELVTQSVWAAKVCEAIIDDDSDRVVEIIDKLHPYVKQQLLIVLPQIASHRGVRQGGIFSTSEGWLKAIIAAAGVPKDKITSWIDNFALSGADIATALQLPSPPRPNNENQIEALEQKPDSEDPTMVDSREQNEGTTSINERGMKLGTSERVNEFHRLVKEGYSHRKAKKSAHCDPSTYYRWCKEATGEDPIKPYR
ncbi:hypothetical protein KFU94_09090 [Chloroflexi bacterium TSY]|nr:hypothetical protein [Chloroflexi bacterium TSY]